MNEKEGEIAKSSKPLAKAQQSIQGFVRRGSGSMVTKNLEKGLFGEMPARNETTQNEMPFTLSPSTISHVSSMSSAAEQEETPQSATNENKSSYHKLFPASTYHPSLNGTPDELEIKFEDGDIQVDTGVNVDAMREEMVIAWNELAWRCSKRFKHLTSTSMNLPRTASFETDVVNLGIISRENAQERLDFYQNYIYKQHPMVIVPDVPLDELRKEHPKLFLAVMATASHGINDKNSLDANLILYNHCYESIIYDTMIAGVKTFELLKALVLLIFWYDEPDFYHHNKCHLLINLAVSIASDLGIGGLVVSSRHVSLKFERIMCPQVLVDPFTIECRHMWLFIYCCSMNMINVVRRPNFFLWTPYTEDCCNLLENSDVPSSHKKIAFFARLTRILEEIYKALYSGQSGSKNPPAIDDCRTKYLVEYFEGKLRDIRQRARENGIDQSVTFNTAYRAIQVYLYQVVLYVKFDENVGRSPFTEYSLAIFEKNWSSYSITCLLNCYSATVECISVFCSLSPLTLCSLPLFNYSRLVFSVSIMLKLRVLSLINPEIAKVCPVKRKQFNMLFDIMGKLNEVSQKYPFANNALCFNFVIKLLMCHFDRQVHFYCLTTECQRDPQNTKLVEMENIFRLRKSFPMPGDDSSANGVPRPSQQSPASNVMTTNNGFLSVNNNPGNHDGQSNRQSFSLPVSSPLDILSSVASRHGSTNPSPRPPTDGTGPEIVTADQRKETNLMPDFDGQGVQNNDGLWLTGEEFWKELISNVEAYTSFEM